MPAVPEKSEGEEDQNAITVSPEDTSTKKSSALLSSRLGSNRSLGNQSEDSRKQQSVPKQPRPKPRNTTVHESLKKQDTPITLAITSSVNSQTPSQTQFTTSLAIQSSTSTTKPTTQTSRLAIQSQPFVPTEKPVALTRQEPPTPTKTSINPTESISTQPVRQPITFSRPSFSPPKNQPLTFPIIQSSTQPSSQLVTQTNTKLTTEATTFPAEILVTPASPLITPIIEPKDDNVNPFTHTSTEIPFFSVRKNLTLPRFTKVHVAQKEENPEQTELPRKNLNMMPASVARRPGNRFSFTSNKDEELIVTPEELQRIVFQPFLTLPRTKTRRILTNAPSLLPIDPANSSDEHHHLFPMRIEFHDTGLTEDSSFSDSLGFKLSNSQEIQTPSRPLSEFIDLPPLSAFLTPPKHPFSIITAMKQEFPTLLESPPETETLRTSSRDTFLPGARRLPFPTPSQVNRDFFIPSAEFSLLVSEVPQNNVKERILLPNPKQSNHHQDLHGSHMTMVFPAPIEHSKMAELKLNPECPRCHPEFLKPGQCHPCVVIK